LQTAVLKIMTDYPLSEPRYMAIAMPASGTSIGNDAQPTQRRGRLQETRENAVHFPHVTLTTLIPELAKIDPRTIFTIPIKPHRILSHKTYKSHTSSTIHDSRMAPLTRPAPTSLLSESALFKITAIRISRDPFCISPRSYNLK